VTDNALAFWRAYSLHSVL